MKLTRLLPSLLLFILVVNLASASVGVGMNPAKASLVLEGGKTQTMEVTVFNTGDTPLEISLQAEGDIAPYVDFEPKSVVVDPEPVPHTLPVKNGKIFTVKFTPPASSQVVSYSGDIAATAFVSNGNNFPGTVGTAMLVEATVNPPLPLKGVLGVLTVQQLVLVAAIIPMILSVFLLIRQSSKKKKSKKK